MKTMVNKKHSDLWTHNSQISSIAYTYLSTLYISILCVCKSRTAFSCAMRALSGERSLYTQPHACFYYSAAIAQWYARAIVFRSHLVKGNGSTFNVTTCHFGRYSRRRKVIEQYCCHFFLSVTRGLSARSLRRFCKKHSIGKAKGPALDSSVSRCITTVGCYIQIGCIAKGFNFKLSVGHSYGRKMMKGHLASQGFRVSESRIGQSLKRVCRDAYEAH